MFEVSWSVFIEFVVGRGLLIQYVDDGTTYYLWATDGVIVAQCRIPQNGDADQTDFETNYKSSSNQPLLATSVAFDGGEATVNQSATPWVFNLPTNASTDTLQSAGNGTLTSLDNKFPGKGQALMSVSIPVAIASNQTSIPVAATLAAETTKVIGTVNVSSGQTVGIAAGSAVIGHVIADSGSTTAVTGNVATTQADGSSVTLGAKADAKSTATDTTAISMMSVLKQISASAQTPPSQAVTNAGTFATQATLAAETTKVIGTVNVSSGQTIGIAAGAAVIGHVIADSGSTTAVTGNVASTVADGADVTLGAKADAKSTATDTTAVSIMSVLKQISASSQAPPSSAVTNTGTFAVQATLAAETTKVIGTVNVASSQVIGITTGSAQIGHLEANQSVNIAQVNGGTTVASVTGVQNVMPVKRTGSTGLAPIYSANHITSKTTTTPTSSTAYISSIVISCTGAGTAWTLAIKDKQATPLTLVPAFTLAVPTTGLPVIISFVEPLIMTSGIDIITAGTTAGTVDVFITYWQ